MQLHLLLPGLLWPARVLHDCAYDLELPALARLLGRGRILWQEPLALEQALCREFAVVGDQPPYAALRLLGEGIAAAEGTWLCADPSHLAIEQGRLTLGSEDLAIGAAEMQELLAAVQPLLCELPGFLGLRAGAAGSGHAYLQLQTPPQLLTTPPSAARGFSVDDALPRGAQAQSWLKIGNEVQMALHALPGNPRREAEGRPVINSLWFWGAGALPVPPQAPPYTTVLGAGALLHGLARWSAVASGPLPERFAAAPRQGATLICLEQLAAPTQALDVDAWRKALLELERNWFAPIAAAFFSGRLGALRITALGSEAAFEFSLRSSDRLRFWTRPRPLASLSP